MYKVEFCVLGIGDWGLGIGDWGLGQNPNSQITKKKNKKIILIVIQVVKRIIRI